MSNTYSRMSNNFIANSGRVKAEEFIINKGDGECRFTVLFYEQYATIHAIQSCWPWLLECAPLVNAIEAEKHDADSFENLLQQFGFMKLETGDAFKRVAM